MAAVDQLGLADRMSHVSRAAAHRWNFSKDASCPASPPSRTLDRRLHREN